jgi:hypothetical protein
MNLEPKLKYLITILEGEFTVYDLGVEDNDLYIANGVLTHNKIKDNIYIKKEKMSCLSYDTIINNGGLINENIDDSVSVFVNNSGSLVPYILTKNCCELLKTGYTFDIDTQICNWTTRVLHV